MVCIIGRLISIPLSQGRNGVMLAGIDARNKVQNFRGHHPPTHRIGKLLTACDIVLVEQDTNHFELLCPPDRAAACSIV